MGKMAFITPQVAEFKIDRPNEGEMDQTNCATGTLMYPLDKKTILDQPIQLSSL